MMLQMSVPLAGSPQFPMQFDHHVYLDPDHSNVFFLKVKGIPLIHSETNGIFQTKSSTIKLARFAQDSIDYQNNVASDGSVITPSELGLVPMVKPSMDRFLMCGNFYHQDSLAPLVSMVRSVTAWL